MIRVQLHQNNFFSLQGYSIEPTSRIQVDQEGYTLWLRVRGCNPVERRNLSRSQVLPALRDELTALFRPEDIAEPELNQYLDYLQAFADRHFGLATPAFDYNLNEQLQRITELAPVVPPEYLKRIVPQVPVVLEAVALLDSWYLHLSHSFYQAARAKLKPGTLDRYLDRMDAVLKELKPGHKSLERLKGEEVVGRCYCPIEHLVIEGENEAEGAMVADGTRPPFALFCPELQHNVGGPYAQRGHAEAALEVMRQGGMVPYTSRLVVWTVGNQPSPWYDKE